MVLSSVVAWAQPRTDVVTLANGDRITGEIVELDRGRLEFKTDDAGTIYFDWDKIVRVDTEPTQNVEGLLGFQTSYYTYDRPRTNVDASVDYYPSLSNWGRQRLQINAAVKRELWKDFFAALNLYDTFDSVPPSPEAARNDVGVVVSIGWSY